MKKTIFSKAIAILGSIAMLVGVSGGDPLKYALTLEKCAQQTGVDFIGERYDMGNKFDVARAYVEQAAVHPEIGEQFCAFVREFAAKL